MGPAFSARRSRHRAASQPSLAVFYRGPWRGSKVILALGSVSMHPVFVSPANGTSVPIWFVDSATWRDIRASLDQSACAFAEAAGFSPVAGPPRVPSGPRRHARRRLVRSGRSGHAERSVSGWQACRHFAARRLPVRQCSPRRTPRRARFRPRRISIHPLWEIREHGTARAAGCDRRRRLIADRRSGISCPRSHQYAGKRHGAG